MVALPGKPGKTCWCWIVSTFTIKITGIATGLTLQPFEFVGSQQHRMDIECTKKCDHGIQSSLDMNMGVETLEIEYTRKKCCGECNLPKVHCGGQSQFVCDSGIIPLGRPSLPQISDLWDLRNNLNNSQDKIKGLLDIIIKDLDFSAGAGHYGGSYCPGGMRCGNTKIIKGLCGDEPKWV